MSGGALRWGRRIGVGLAASLCGLAAAAALLDSVTLTVAGAVAAACIVTVLDIASALLLVRSTRSPRLMLVAFVPVTLLTAAGLVLAAYAVPGFAVHGIWGYLGTFALLFGAGYLVDRIVPGKEAAEQPPPLRGKRWESYEAALRIGELAQARDTAGLIDELRSPAGPDRHGRVRGSAVVALGELGDPLAVPPLLELIDDDSELVRMLTLTALGQIGAPEAIPGVMSRLDDSAVVARSAAARSLGRLGAHDAVEPLGRMFRSDPDDSVRWYAARALAALGDTTPADSIPSIIDGLPWWAFSRRGRWKTALADFQRPA